MSQNLQNIAKFQKFQLENLVDFEKCCKKHILLQKSEPIQPKTINILPKFCRPRRRAGGGRRRRRRAPRGEGGQRFRGGLELAIFAKIVCKFLAGSFSAVLSKNLYCAIICFL